MGPSYEPAAHHDHPVSANTDPQVGATAQRVRTGGRTMRRGLELLAGEELERGPVELLALPTEVSRSRARGVERGSVGPPALPESRCLTTLVAMVHTSEEVSALTDALVDASRALVAVAARSLADVEEVTLPQWRALVVLTR